MKWKWPDKWNVAFDKYKYVLVVILVGALLLLPGGKKGQPQQEVGAVQAPVFDLTDMERRLEMVLSKVSGAGKVSVVLTLKESGRQVYAQDVSVDQREQTSTTVVISRGNGVEETVPVQTYSPTFQGALAVCPGGGDPTVRLQLTQAICALTGLSTEKISVCQSEH